MRSPQHFNINLKKKIIGKLLLMDKKLILVGHFKINNNLSSKICYENIMEMTFL